MATRLSLISFIIFLFLFSSCKSKTEGQKNPTEKISGKDFTKTKTLFIDTILNDKKFILQKTLYENGNFKLTGFFSPDTIMQGKWTSYYPNGKVESIINYSNGLKDGYCKSFHDNGQLWTVIRYSKGKTMDIVSNYDRNGKLQRKGNLKNGYGTIIIYDENGDKKNIERYENGKLVKN